MKAIIFAGGVGTRLWPLSRKSSPKQFEKVIGNKSTLELSIERLVPDFAWEDIYISTNKLYVDQLNKQLPKLPLSNIIGEPETRDVGPAVALITAILHKSHPRTPMVILWSDHLIKKQDLFKKILSMSRKQIEHKKHHIIFITQKPRFASQNLGWIKYGAEWGVEDGIAFRQFTGFKYRPSLPEAAEFFKSGHYGWNTGYFVTTPSYLKKQFRQFQPEITDYLDRLEKAYGSKNFKSELNKIYPLLPKISFDNAILEKIPKDDGLVVSEDLGWSDVGAWEALKEALQTGASKNVVKGKVVVTDCEDSLIYNYTDQLLVTIDLNGHLVINTPDVVLVCHKDSVPKIKKLVESLSNSENEHLV